MFRLRARCSMRACVAGVLRPSPHRAGQVRSTAVRKPMIYVFVCWEGDLEQVGSGVQPLSYGQDAGLNGRETVASLLTWRAQHFTQAANALARHRPTENTSTCQTQRLGAQRDVRTDAGAPAAATAGGSREGFKQTRAFPDYGCNQSARGLAFPASRWRRNEL